MKLLLDTATFLWVASGDERLSETARGLVTDGGNEAFLSPVSTWEIAVKAALGRLPLPEAPDVYVPRLREAHRIDSLPLDEESTLYLDRLPDIHRDPFDRMLICQAIVRGLVLLTPDPDIRRYPVRTRW